jgi:alkylhydroperoxidase family enzyme
MVTLALGTIVSRGVRQVRLSKPRIPPINQNTATAEQQEALCELDVIRRSLNVYRTIVRHPELAKRFIYATHYIFFESTLPPRDRELMILRIRWLCRAEYEWSRHSILATQAGITDSEILRIVEGPAAEGWTAFQRTLLKAVDELHEDAFISDTTWNALAREYSEEQLMDLVFTVGQYNFVSMALNSFGVQLDEGGAGFPRTARATSGRRYSDSLGSL